MQPLEILKKNVVNAHGEMGKRWFENLDDTLNKLKKHWSLSDISPVPNMSWNYVAFATHHTYPVVVKLSCDSKSIAKEYLTLQHFKAMGAVKIITYSARYQALLLERAIPGRSLKEHHCHNSHEVISIYADVVRKLSSHPRPKQAYPHVSEWCKVIDDINDPRIPAAFVERAKEIRTKLLETMTHDYLCHGDLHLENIIQQDTEWIAIDPKGVIGEMAFEAAAFDLVEDTEFNHPPNNPILSKRIQQLAEALNIDPQRLSDWIFLKIMISIQWFIEDRGDPTRMIQCAQSIYPLC